MRVLSFARNAFRRVLLRVRVLLFGQSFFICELEELQHKLEVQAQKLNLLAKALVELDDRHRKSEWKSVVENAIHGLDQKAQMLREAIDHQQGAIEYLEKKQRTYKLGGIKVSTEDSSSN